MILSEFLRHPEACAEYSIHDWERLFQLARAGEILARVDGILREKALFDFVPQAARWLLKSARVRYERSRRQMLWELNRIRKALKDEPRVVLLKGAAYVAAELPWAVGRISVDADIMVPQERLSNTESQLLVHGWIYGRQSEYDERFYRDWTHELPPMVHYLRGTNLDVHHTILPPTNKIHVPTEKLFEAALPLEEPFFVLAPCDMVLHCVAHAFQDGDLANDLKDLLDFDAMLRYFGGRDSDFETRLARRTEELNLQRPMYYALRYVHKMLGTPISQTLSQAGKPWRPGWFVRQTMDFCVPRSLLPQMPGEETWSAALSRRALLARQHWLRMPLSILIPHLWKKWRERREKKIQDG